jgi:hypothetical protein
MYLSGRESFLDERTMDNYTKFDWARDRYDLSRWDEDGFARSIDKRMRKTSKLNKKNHRNYV